MKYKCNDCDHVGQEIDFEEEESCPNCGSTDYSIYDPRADEDDEDEDEE